jgi:hypothetical protein
MKLSPDRLVGRLHGLAKEQVDTRLTSLRVR